MSVYDVMGASHTRQEEHFALLNPDVPELFSVHYTQEHSALVLVKPFLGAIQLINRFYQRHI